MKFLTLDQFKTLTWAIKQDLCLSGYQISHVIVWKIPENAGNLMARGLFSPEFRCQEFGASLLIHIYIFIYTTLTLHSLDLMFYTLRFKIFI